MAPRQRRGWLLRISLVLLVCCGYETAEAERVVEYRGTYWGTVEGADRIQHAVMGPDGNIYATGSTQGQQFPGGGQNVYGTNSGHSDVFVSIFSPNLEHRRTRIVGGDYRDTPYRVEVFRDEQGRLWIYVFLVSWNSTFPVVGGGLPDPGTDTDPVIAKFDSQLNLVKSTYLGGDGGDGGRGVATISPTGTIYFAFHTSAACQGVTAASFQTQHAGGPSDICLVEMDRDLNVRRGTYLGGSAEDVAYGIGLLPNGNIALGGMTRSSNYPVTAGAFQTRYGGHGSQTWMGDTFLTVLRPDLTVVASTYYGGTDGDGLSVNNGFAIEEPTGNIVIIGDTESLNLPTTPQAFQRTSPSSGNVNFWAAKFPPDLRQLLAATYLGTNGLDESSGVDQGSGGMWWIGGNTQGTNLPTTPDAFQPIYRGGNGDAFLMALDNTFSRLHYATYLGGSGTGGYGDRIRALFWKGTNSSKVVVVGDSPSADFPTTPGTAQPTHANAQYTDGVLGELTVRETSAPLCDVVDFHDNSIGSFQLKSATGAVDITPAGALTVTNGTLRMALPSPYPRSMKFTAKIQGLPQGAHGGWLFGARTKEVDYTNDPNGGHYVGLYSGSGGRGNVFYRRINPATGQSEQVASGPTLPMDLRTTPVLMIATIDETRIKVHVNGQSAFVYTTPNAFPMGYASYRMQLNPATGPGTVSTNYLLVNTQDGPILKANPDDRTVTLAFDVPGWFAITDMSVGIDAIRLDHAGLSWLIRQWAPLGWLAFEDIQPQVTVMRMRVPAEAHTFNFSLGPYSVSEEFMP